MEPLRNVGIIDQSSVDQMPIAERGFAPVDNPVPSRRFAEVYMDFLDGLTDVERKIMAERSVPAFTGEVADRVGIDDTTDHEFRLLVSDDPDETRLGSFVWRHSETVEALEEELDDRWVAAAVAAGITEPYNGEDFTYDNGNQARSSYSKGHDRLVKGFERSVAEIIYGDYRQGYPAEDPRPYIVELMTDGSRLRELVNRWYDENLAARQAARAANLGSVAASA